MSVQTYEFNPMTNNPMTNNATTNNATTTAVPSTAGLSNTFNTTFYQFAGLETLEKTVTLATVILKGDPASMPDAAFAYPLIQAAITKVLPLVAGRTMSYKEFIDTIDENVDSVFIENRSEQEAAIVQMMKTITAPIRITVRAFKSEARERARLVKNEGAEKRSGFIRTPLEALLLEQAIRLTQVNSQGYGEQLEGYTSLSTNDLTIREGMI